MMGEMGQGFGFGMGFGWIIPFAILGLLIWCAVHFFRSASNRDSASGESREGKALDFLKDRYARGEIDTETFETMRRNLE